MYNALLSSTSSTMLIIPYLYVKPTSVSSAPFNSHSTFLTLIHTLHLSNYLPHLDYQFCENELQNYISVPAFGSQPMSLTVFFSTKVCTSTYSLLSSQSNHASHAKPAFPFYCLFSIHGTCIFQLTKISSLILSYLRAL